MVLDVIFQPIFPLYGEVMFFGLGRDGDDICNTIIKIYIKFKFFSNHSHE
jgi:hypothetical protein